jgi:hypothetical protein
VLSALTLLPPRAFTSATSPIQRSEEHDDASGTSGGLDVHIVKVELSRTNQGEIINRGRTVLRGIAHIEEVNRILEVLTSIGVTYEWRRGV